MMLMRCAWGSLHWCCTKGIVNCWKFLGTLIGQKNIKSQRRVFYSEIILAANYVKLRGKLKPDIEEKSPTFMNGGETKNVNPILQKIFPCRFSVFELNNF